MTTENQSNSPIVAPPQIQVDVLQQNQERRLAELELLVSEQTKLIKQLFERNQALSLAANDCIEDIKAMQEQKRDNEDIIRAECITQLKRLIGGMTLSIDEQLLQ